MLIGGHPMMGYWTLGELDSGIDTLSKFGSKYGATRPLQERREVIHIVAPALENRIFNARLTGH